MDLDKKCIYWKKELDIRLHCVILHIEQEKQEKTTLMRCFSLAEAA